MSDEEAGRIGYRRMSQTPIPQVAETAAEVADTAAILDKDDIVSRSLSFQQLKGYKKSLAFMIAHPDRAIELESVK